MRKSFNEKSPRAENLHVGVNPVKITRCHGNTFRRRPLHGFTLVELLVVISIIALLVSILMPALAKVRAQAKFVLCKTQLHQYGLAAELMLGDNNGAYPANAYHTLYKSLYGKSPSGKILTGYCMWHDEANSLKNDPTNGGPLWSYLETQDVHLCPEFYKVGIKYGPEHTSHNPSIPIVPQFSYTMNSLLGTFDSGGVKKVTQIRRPSETFFFGEENLWKTPGVNQNDFNDTALFAVPPAGADPYSFKRTTIMELADAFGSFHLAPSSDRNGGKTNAIFVDGHVEDVRPEQSFWFSRPK